MTYHLCIAARRRLPVKLSSKKELIFKLIITQSDSHGKKIFIVPTPINNRLEKYFKVLQRRNTLHLASGYEGMVSYRYSRHFVTAKGQGILALTRQGEYESFCNRVVDRITTIFGLSKELSPKGIQVTQSFFHQVTSRWMYIRQHCIQLAAQSYDNLFLQEQDIDVQAICPSSPPLCVQIIC